MIIAGTLALAVSPFLVGRIIDKVTHQSSAGLVTLLVTLALLQISAGFLRSTASRISAVRAEEISHDLRLILARTIFHERKDHAAIAQQSRGRTLSLFNRDIEALWDLFGFAITELVASIFMIFALGLIVFYLSPYVGLLFIVIATVFCFAYFFNGQKIRALFGAAAPRFDDMVSLINATLDGYETIASFRRQSWAISSIGKMSRHVTDLTVSAHQRVARFSFTTGTINTLGIMAVWAFALPGLVNGTPGAMTLGELVAILFYFTMLTEPLETVSGAAKAISKGTVSMKRITSFEAEMRNLEASKENTAAIPAGPFFFDVAKNPEMPLVRLRDARDKPKGEQPSVLKPISLNLSRGQILGLAGSSGSGKSTLLRLMARLLSENGHGLWLEGQPYQIIDEATFRQRVCYLPQNPAVFPVSLSENTFVDATATELQSSLGLIGMQDRAARLSDTEDVLRAGLSGGEMQRLALSRLFFKKPQLLLIDEPTSALDHTNSRSVFDAIAQHMTAINGATVIASHDKTVLEMCDQIVVMQDGGVAGIGDFQTLCAQSDVFCRVVEDIGLCRA